MLNRRQINRNPEMIVSQNCIDFDTKTYRFGHISGPSYRGAHAGWPAGWVVRRMPAMRLEHQNASKMRPLHQKVRRKCDPSPKMRSEMQPLRQKKHPTPSSAHGRPSSRSAAEMASKFNDIVHSSRTPPITHPLSLTRTHADISRHRTPTHPNHDRQLGVPRLLAARYDAHIGEDILLEHLPHLDHDILSRFRPYERHL